MVLQQEGTEIEEGCPTNVTNTARLSFFRSGENMSRIIVTLCVAMSAYAPAETNSVASKVIVDANSGQHAEVDAKKEVVSLYDKDGKVVWSNNVVDSVKMSVGTNTNMLHQVGGKIHSIQLYKDGLWIGVGRGYAILDIKTGNFKGTASR